MFVVLRAVAVVVIVALVVVIHVIRVVSIFTHCRYHSLKQTVLLVMT